MNTSNSSIIRFCLAAIAAALVAPFVFGQMPEFQWATLVPGEGEYEAADLAADMEGNAIVAQREGELTGVSGLIKLSPQGGVLWTNGQLPHIEQLATDASGGIYVAGSSVTLVSGQYVATNWFADRQIATQGAGSGYLAKLTPAGVIDSVRLVGNTSPTEATAVAVDSEGNCYLGGQYQTGEGRFGDTVLPANSAHTIFIAKYDRNGLVRWVRGGSTGYGLYKGVMKIAPDHAGNAYVACMAGSVAFDDLVVAGNPSFLAKLDFQGRILWTRILTDQAGLPAIAVDADGNCLVALSNGSNGVLTKYSAAGDLLWSRQAQASSDLAGIYLPKLTVDTDGNCFFAGSFYDGSVSFQNVTVQTDARWEVFVTKYSSSGDVRWAIQSQGLDPEGDGSSLRISNTLVAGIAIAPDGGILMGGTISGTVQFGDTTLDGPPNNGTDSIVAARIIDPDPPLPRLGIAADKSGLHLSWAASLSGFVLESSDHLSSPTWTQVSASSIVDGNENVVTLQIDNGPKYFRLHKP